MAELIPLEYRISVARSTSISRWAVTLGLTLAVAAGGLFCIYNWKNRQSREFARLDDEYRRNYSLIKESKALQDRRADLANRMTRIEQLQQDKILLSLLKSVSDGFSANDCLQYIRVEAHPSEPKVEQKYFVRIRGITVNDTTHSELYQRLTEIGKKTQPPLAVPLGEHHVMKVIDGEATFFEFTCEQPVPKSLASSDRGN